VGTGICASKPVEKITTQLRALHRALRYFAKPDDSALPLGGDGIKCSYTQIEKVRDFLIHSLNVRKPLVLGRGNRLL